MLDWRKHRSAKLCAGVGVGNAHDAFAMADKLSDAPHVEVAVSAGDAMDFDEVVAERVGARAIRVGKNPALRDTFEVEKNIRRLLRSRSAERTPPRCPAKSRPALKRTDVERAYMARQPVERVFLPQQNRRASTYARVRNARLPWCGAPRVEARPPLRIPPAPGCRSRPASVHGPRIVAENRSADCR